MLLVLIFTAAIFVSARLAVLFLAYQARYVKCDSEKLLDELERTFDIEFPSNIKDLKTAKTSRHGLDASISFIAKFTAKPETVDNFLASFKGGVNFDVPYDQDDDLRGAYAWTPPMWFTVPIRKGRRVRLNASTAPHIYIDTTDEENYIVYLRGSLQ